MQRIKTTNMQDGVRGGEGVEIAIIALGGLVLYLGVKCFVLRLSLYAYIAWMEDAKYTQPTSQQFNSYKEKILRQMLRIRG